MNKRQIFLILALVAILFQPLVSESLDDKLRATQSDIKVLCLASQEGAIQWGPLIYLNQKYGCEIFIGLVNLSPGFGSIIKSSADGQFHLGRFGQPAVDSTDSMIVDSIVYYLLDGNYPDLAVCGFNSREDSLSLVNILLGIRDKSTTDSLGLTSLEKIFIETADETNGLVLFNDRELFQKYSARVASVSKELGLVQPLKYTDRRLRRYRRFMNSVGVEGTVAENDFMSGFDSFRLPDFVSGIYIDGPERKNILTRISKFRSFIRNAQRVYLERSERLRFVLAALKEITYLDDLLRSRGSDLRKQALSGWVNDLKKKTYIAASEAVGLDWKGHLEMRQTPFGKSVRLTIDLKLTGPLPIELSLFKFHPGDFPAVIIDSISHEVLPHQRFYRNYPINLDNLDLSLGGASENSLLFSVEVIVEKVALNLFLPYSEYSDSKVGIEFLPGYAFLPPFSDRDNQITALAKTFDWQIKITKPFEGALDGRLLIDRPDAIVVGSYNKKIHIPDGVTSKYIDIYLAAGRSIEYNLKNVTARLEVDNKKIAETSAQVRVVRCDIPATRDIAFIPDPDGQLEDFLRVANVSMQALTAHGLIRANLEAFDVLIIGSGPTEFYSNLRATGGRLQDFVRNGGEIIIMGQPFGWPHNVFDFPIYCSAGDPEIKASVISENHAILNRPYKIDISHVLKQAGNGLDNYPTIMIAGTELISAGEHGSLLRVTRIGEGHIIYCGLPVLELVGGLDVEAIHLMANLLNFGNGK